MQLGDYLTTGRIARHFKVAPRTVAKWIDSGQLKGHRQPGASPSSPCRRRVTVRTVLRFALDHGVPVPEALLPLLPLLEETKAA